MVHDLNIKVDGRSDAMKKNFGPNYAPTVANIVSTWAPATDKNDPKAYAAFVSKQIGLKPDDVVTPDKVPELAKAMATFEGNPQNGSLPTPAGTPSIDPNDPLAKYKNSPTLKASILEATTQFKSAKRVPSQQELLGATLAIEDKKFAANMKEGLDPYGNEVKPDKQTLSLYGVPEAPANAAKFGARGDTLKYKLEEDAGKAEGAAHQIEQDAMEFKKLLDAGMPTGGIANAVSLLRQNTDAQFQIAKAINKDFTLSQFKAGSGLRTQKEFQTIQDANASPIQKEEAARAIANKSVAEARILAERARFKSNYAQAHNTLDGSGAYYNKYLEANPVFDEIADGHFNMVEGRKSFSEYFQPSATSETTPPSDAPATSVAPTVGKPFKFQK
jgi:hypothetical protein